MPTLMRNLKASQLLVAIRNPDTGNTITTYTTEELHRLARAAVKGKGRMFAHTLSIDQRTGGVSLHVSFFIDGNPLSQTYTSIAL